MTACRHSVSVALMLGLAVTGCRPDPGKASYPDTGSGRTSGDTGAGDDLPKGPDPYEAGEARLSVGLHYESGYSDLLEINDVDRHYYIFENTYSEEVETQDVVEGRESTLIVHGDIGWFGGGITWDVPQDLSAWTTMYVSLRSGDPGFAELALHMTGGGTETIVQATSYGWVNDGQWHHLEVPLQDFVDGGTDLSAVTAPFVLIGAGGAVGESLKIDNLYYTQD